MPCARVYCRVTLFKFWFTLPQVRVDPVEVGAAALYPLVISAVAPRPIAFICSESSAGVRNLSPYSYFNAVSHDPPILAMGATGALKLTFQVIVLENRH